MQLSVMRHQEITTHCKKNYTTTHQLPAPSVYSTLAEERGAIDEITNKDTFAQYSVIGANTLE